MIDIIVDDNNTLVGVPGKSVSLKQIRKGRGRTSFLASIINPIWEMRLWRTVLITCDEQGLGRAMEGLHALSEAVRRNDPVFDLRPYRFNR